MVIFKGVGEATAKCISCVEVFKRNYKVSSNLLSPNTFSFSIFKNAIHTLFSSFLSFDFIVSLVFIAKNRSESRFEIVFTSNFHFQLSYKV